MVLPSIAAAFTAAKQQQSDTIRTAVGGNSYCQCGDSDNRCLTEKRRQLHSILYWNSSILATLSFLQPLVCFRCVTRGHFNLKPLLRTRLISSQKWLYTLHPLNWAAVDLKVDCRRSEIACSSKGSH